MDKHQEQFSLIYDQYIEKIYRFVYLKVNSEEVTQDITSKVFLRGFEAFKKAPEIKNIGAFLYQIARNSVVDHYREKDRLKTVNPEHVAEVVDQKANVHEKAAMHADIELVKSAIQNLKKDYQDVLILHYLEDMGTEQIAQVLNKPVGTVRVMIHRGLNMLKDQLVQED